MRKGEGGREGQERGGDPLLFRYTPSHYILDKCLTPLDISTATSYAPHARIVEIWRSVYRK